MVNIKTSDMSKDPAFLFYSNDFLSGTFTMTDEQVGKYIRLLCIQHQKTDGLLTEKDMMNICKTYDLEIWSKFNKTGDGGYYNDRLRREVERRKSYSKSRSDNRRGLKINTYNDEDMKNICLSCDNHMETETETINESCKSCYKKSKYKKVKAKKEFIAPTVCEVAEYFVQSGYRKEAGEKAWLYYNTAAWHDAKGNKVRNWKQKMQSVWFKPENQIKKEGVLA